MEDTKPQRFGSFFNRVQVEREALKIVNSSLLGTVKLNGLTAAAIDVWSMTGSTNDTPSKTIAAEILKQISVRIEALADQSRTVFADERFPTLPTHDLLIDLQKALTK